MIQPLIRYITRPQLGANNIENEAFQQYNGYSFSDIRGNGGHNYNRSINPLSYVTMVIGPTLKMNNPAVTGNINGALSLQSLTDEDLRGV